MKVLLDHCVPRPFASLVVGHDVSTTEEMGWQDEANGALLKLAATKFEVFITVDKSLSRQQNVVELPLAVVVLRSRSNSIRDLARHAPVLLRTLNYSLQRRVYVLEEPQDMGRTRRP